MTTLRAIVVGSGWAAHSARSLALDPRTELRAIVGRGSERSVGLAWSLDVPLESSIDLALAQHAPDIVVLAVGERTHEPLAIRCIEAGAHLLCAHPVAPDAAAVGRIAACAERHARMVRTDYTFRIRPELDLLADTRGRGHLLRLAIDAPGRWLPIALDTALVIAGRIGRVAAHRAYPSALAERAMKLPEAFPPTVVLEHITGVVTSIVPFPHSWPAQPVQVRASWERMRVEGMLPRGAVRTVACVRGGRVDAQELLAAEVDAFDAREHARAMEAVARAFVDTVLGMSDRLATLSDEAHLRGVWAALWRAARTGAPHEVPTTP